MSSHDPDRSRRPYPHGDDGGADPSPFRLNPPDPWDDPVQPERPQGKPEDPEETRGYPPEPTIDGDDGLG